jgi:hypothetical protein
MPMDRAFNWQLVDDKHFEFISLINFDQRAWLLVIDEIHLASKTVYILISHGVAGGLVKDSPGALDPL